jgi:hypothetical protein
MKNILTFEDFVNESYSVNEGAVKQFETGVKNLINNIRAGYGWIDPEYVYDTVINSRDFDGINFNDIEEEIYKRLIKANLLYFANPADPEVKGPKATLADLHIKESVNESVDPRVKKEAISRLSDFFRVTANSLNGFNFDGKDNIKALTKALNSTSDQGTELYYKTAIKLAMEEVGIHESEINEANDEFVPATLTEDFEDLRKGDAVKINALEFTKGNDKETIESIRPDGKKMEINKAILTVKI